MHRLLKVCFLALCFSVHGVVVGQDASKWAFFQTYCNDCHSGGADEGGLDLSSLGTDLSDPATFARWQRIYDRVLDGEMPPAESDQPTATDRKTFASTIHPRLFKAHQQSKGTVLRRLNRREYENTINDLFGTHLDLASMLPEDGRSHEFDNVGESLGLSMVHLQLYMDAIKKTLDTAIASRTSAPKVDKVSTGYAETREAEKFLGSKWKKLSDGAVVRFSGGGYPTGMIRGTGVRKPGRYRIRVFGYGYQTKDPITFSVGGTSFVRGSDKPIYGYWSFPPGKPGDMNSIELDAWIEDKYMIAIEPYGINDPDRYKRETINNYGGPGLAIHHVEIEGPIVDRWPLDGHRLIFDGLDRREVEPSNPKLKTKSWYKPVFEVKSDDTKAKAVIKRVATAAFRGNANEQDFDRYWKLFSDERSKGSTFEDAIQTTVMAIFCSPKFLYLQENPGELHATALANRLSYFLARTAPDDRLMALAKDKSILQGDVLRRETERLLEDARFQRFLVDFTDNWLDLRDLDFTIPDRKLFPEYDDYLRYSMPLETREFVHELVRSNLPASNIIQSDFAMLNSRLAAHYDLPPVNGSELQKVKLPNDSLRGGLLSQASILKVTANGTNTSPVTRGAWVMERIFGTPPPPPPPGIPGVEPDIRGASTLRDLLEKHRDTPSCNACHQKIDPPGFALESFNPIGGFRENYRSLGAGDRSDTVINGRRVSYKIGPQVDSSGELPNKDTFNNYVDFRRQIASDEKRLATTLTTKLLTFATGRELGFSDRKAVQAIVQKANGNGYRVRDLVHLVIQSKIFRSK